MNVMQPWVGDLTLMQQSVLISACRAPDGLGKEHVAKLLWRWLRRCFLLSAFDRRILFTPDEIGGGSFTGPVDDIDAASRRYLKLVDEVPHHAHLHLLHAAEILGYKHPEAAIRNWWLNFYYAGVRDMHMQPESEYDLDFRLGDVERQWRVHEAFPAEEGTR